MSHSLYLCYKSALNRATAASLLTHALLDDGEVEGLHDLSGVVAVEQITAVLQVDQHTGIAGGTRQPEQVVDLVLLGVAVLLLVRVDVLPLAMPHRQDMWRLRCRRCPGPLHRIP